MEKLLALVAIVRDEAHTIAKTLNSCAEACDEFVIVDTGSTDDTLGVVYDWNGKQDKTLVTDRRPWVDYSHNRNEALDLAKGRAKWALSLSADETLHGGEALRAFLANYEGPEEALLVEVRTETEKFDYPRVIKPDSPWRYVGAVHEQPQYTTDKKREAAVKIPGVYIEYAATDPARRAKRMREFHVPALEQAIKGKSSHTDRARSMLLLAQTHEFLAVHDSGGDMIEAARQQYAALMWYAIVSFNDYAPEATKTQARFHYLYVAETLGLYMSNEMARRLAPLSETPGVDPAVHFMLAKHVAAVDTKEGLQVAYKAARVIRDAIGENGADPHGLLWKTHFIAASCAKHLGHGTAARKSAEAALAAGAPPEEIAPFLDNGHATRH